MTTTAAELRGSDKKEAFHEAAEAKVKPFKFAVPDIEFPDSNKVFVKLGGTDSVRASVVVMRNGSDNNLHYHPNMDLIYMVLRGGVRFYGTGDKVLGELHTNEGILLPENARYWFESIGSDEAWLLQIGGFPKGPKAVKRIPVAPAKHAPSGVWVGASEEEEETRRKNNIL